MVIKNVWEWDTDPQDNVFDPVDGGMPELMLRSGVNDSARARMSSMRTHYNDSEWIRVTIQGPDAPDIGTVARISATQFEITLLGVDLTSYFTKGRIIKCIEGGGIATDITTQVDDPAAAYDGVSITTVNVILTPALDPAISDVYVHSNSLMRALGAVDTTGSFYIPLTADSAGINAAIGLADAAGGGTVLLVEEVYAVNNAGGPVDLATNGNVILRGVSASSKLEQASGQNMDYLVIMDIPVAKNWNNIENMEIDGNSSNQSGGLNHGIDVRTGASDSKISNISFTSIEGCIHLTGSTITDLWISNCNFNSYLEFAIRSDLATDAHSGWIVNCRFNGLFTTNANAQALDITGTWTISGNNFDDIGDSSTVTHGIRMLSKTAVATGGRESTISGNRIYAGAGTQGTMIEVGGDRIAITGNSIIAPTAGTGIYVNSLSGGQIAEGCSISGNTISQGSPIKANIRTRSTVIAANACNPGAGLVGIESDGESPSISSNTIREGAVGIKLTTNSIDTLVTGNNIRLPTAHGVLLDGAADSPLVISNKIDSLAIGIGITANVTGAEVRNNDFQGTVGAIMDNLSTSTTALGNDPVLGDANHYISGFIGRWNYGISEFEEELVVPNYEGIALPGETGKGRYRLWWNITVHDNQDITMTARVGPLGTIADPVHGIGLVAAAIATTNIPRSEHALLASTEFVSSGATNLLTLTGTSSTNNIDLTINWFYVERMGDE
jgi:hypothetical protein